MLVHPEREERQDAVPPRRLREGEAGAVARGASGTPPPPAPPPWRQAPPGRPSACALYLPQGGARGSDASPSSVPGRERVPPVHFPQERHGLGVLAPLLPDHEDTLSSGLLNFIISNPYMTDEDAPCGNCESECGGYRKAWLEKSPRLHVESATSLSPEGTCSEQGADVRWSHQAAPTPPCPESHTRLSWLVQGAIWGPERGQGSGCDSVALASFTAAATPPATEAGVCAVCGEAGAGSL